VFWKLQPLYKSNRVEEQLKAAAEAAERAIWAAETAADARVQAAISARLELLRNGAQSRPMPFAPPPATMPSRRTWTAAIRTAQVRLDAPSFSSAVVVASHP
jgi:hypothetical protein